jgi:hypothetical protein
MFSVNNSTNSLLKIFFLCPVPDDQKPITEYIELKQNPIFSWIFFKSKKLNLNQISYSICFFFLLNFFTYYFLSSSSSSSSSSSIFGFFYFVCFFFLLQTFFLLKKINTNFQNARLIYEEGSWYQGKIWEKPFLVMKNEKLIRIQKIEPNLQNIKFTFFFFFLFFVPFSFISFIF